MERKRNKYTPTSLPLETMEDVIKALAKFTRMYANGKIGVEQCRTLCSMLRIQLDAMKKNDKKEKPKAKNRNLNGVIMRDYPPIVTRKNI